MFLMRKHDTAKDYTLAAIERANREINESTKPKINKVVALTESEAAEGIKDIHNVHRNLSKNESYLPNFSVEIRKSFLCECLYKIYDKCLTDTMKENITESQKRAIVDNFVTEQGALNLISSFKYRTNLLSEYANIITKYHKAVMEKCNKDDPNSFCIDSDTANTFFDELDAVNADEAIVTIRNRVMDAEEEFLNQNAEDQQDLQTILKATKEKIDGATSDKLKEAYQIEGKRMLNIRSHMRDKTPYEKITEAYVRGIIGNEALLESYTEDGHLKMNKINENVGIMYTFLEMLNSLNIIKVDDNYVNEIVKDLKNPS